MTISKGRKNVSSLAYWQDSYENRYQHLNKDKLKTSAAAD
jgi:hypothetical protein